MKSIIRISLLIIIMTLSAGCSDEEVSTRDYPRLNTLAVSNISEKGATFTAEIIFRGNFEIINYGFVWNKERKPIIENSDKIVFSDNIKSDKFSAEITNSLERNRVYYVRSFIVTEDYTVYGQEVEFLSLGS